MSANSSSSSSPSSASMYLLLQHCLTSTAAASSVVAYVVASLLLIAPACVFVLYLGAQRWRQQRSNAAMSHSDVLTFNMAAAELMGVCGVILMSCGIHARFTLVILPGIYISNLHLSVQMAIHSLTCVERYLAVVHPVTYLSLKEAKWRRNRIIAISCVWLTSAAGTGFLFLEEQTFPLVVCVCGAVFSLAVVCFCSLSVLCVLIRPGPGEGGGGRGQVDQSKLRAFYTITGILVVLLFRLGGNVVITSLFRSELEQMCDLMLSAVWFCLPSSLVLPLLFLQRAGKLLCCTKSVGSG